MSLTAAALTLLALAPLAAADEPFDMAFDDGVDGWRVVVDGVMGGRSSGRVQPGDGTLRFNGTLSLENNGGFSQIRKSVSGDAFVGADGIDLRVRGDGRTYTFDVRCSNARVMAGSFQATFETTAGTWTDVRLPFDSFALYTFGRRVPNAPALDPALIEAIGVTLADKKPGPFELEIDRIAAAGESSPVAPARETGRDLASVARAAGLTTLLDLLSTAGLELPADGRFTILAPTNDAFAKIPTEELMSLLRTERRDTLRAILAHHVVTPAMSSSTLFDRRSVETLGGQRLPIDADGFAVGGASVVAADVRFDRGVVHVIDTVLLPETRSIAALAADDGRFGRLLAAVGAAGLTDLLGPDNGPWTVLAPTDEAFAGLPEGALEDLLRPEQRERLAAVLALHVIPGRVYRKDLLALGSARTLASEPVTFAVDRGRATANGATIIAADVEAANGVVHVIDRVLLPEASSESMAAAGPAISIIERAVAIGAPLFNDGNVEACDAVYGLAIEALLTLAPDRLGRDLRGRLQAAMTAAGSQPSPRERAWVYRQAMDEVYTQLVRRATDADLAKNG